MSLIIRSVLFISLTLLTINVRGQQHIFRLYLIGDAGHEDLGTNGMKELLERNYDQSIPSAFVFLGDNIYPRGMPVEPGADRREAETLLMAQINLVKNTGASVYFVPG